MGCEPAEGVEDYKAMLSDRNGNGAVSPAALAEAKGEVLDFLRGERQATNPMRPARVLVAGAGAYVGWARLNAGWVEFEPANGFSHAPENADAPIIEDVEAIAWPAHQVVRVEFVRESDDDFSGHGKYDDPFCEREATP